MIKSIGVVEGFFGPAWPEGDRRSYAEFLRRVGGDFYIYAPKQDQHLRKGWRETWEKDYVRWLKDLCGHFQGHGVGFGVGLSPFGLGAGLEAGDKRVLKEKLRLLDDLGIDLLGLFFDDMPVTENLASTQLQTLAAVKEDFGSKVIFCPTYYSYDPILEKVFGKRPEGYLEQVAAGTPMDVAVAWTGPKVISPDISEEHLVEVGTLLRRPPFIWENLYANDGPRNCKFLKLRPFSGRTVEAFRHVEACAFNLMNQPQLSKIILLSSIKVMEGAHDSGVALNEAIQELCSPKLQEFLAAHRDEFLNGGLDKVAMQDQEAYLEELAQMPDAIAAEIGGWLRGRYTVGSECLTD